MIKTMGKKRKKPKGYIGELTIKGKLPSEMPVKKKKKKLIFVFGSNLAGRHGKGSAKKARIKYGAQSGIGKGRTGRAYGIPTKDKHLRTLPLKRITYYIQQFFHYAYLHPNLRFKVVKIGCGLAGYSEKQIKPLFRNFRYLKNVRLPEGWKG